MSAYKKLHLQSDVTLTLDISKQKREYPTQKPGKTEDVNSFQLIREGVLILHFQYALLICLMTIQW